MENKIYTFDYDENGAFTINTYGAQAVHHDFKRQDGLYSTFGTGVILNKSGKLGLVTNSSTETEVVSTGEYMPVYLVQIYSNSSRGVP